MRILIEFYSKRTPENLISLLCEPFDAVQFFYFQSGARPSKVIEGQIRRVVKEILNIEPEFLPIENASIPGVLEAFGRFLKEENAYAFDITGGNEIFIAAAGIFLEKNKHLSLSLHRYDIRRGERMAVYPENTLCPTCFPHHLNAPQLLSLNGTPPLSAPFYPFTRGPLRREILRLWEAVKDCPKEWNHFCSFPQARAKSRGATVRKVVGEGSRVSDAYRTVAKKLKEAGILTEEKEFPKGTRMEAELFLNVPREALFLYEKAGNLLEMYMALAAFDAGIFHDIRVGVIVDWNGLIAPGRKPDPRNEVDLVLVHKNLPILASCKNTVPHNEYLYEIMTMARHYGGFFATPMLLTSARASDAVRERAREMEIVLIDGIRDMSFEKTVEKLKKAFE